MATVLGAVLCALSSTAQNKASFEAFADAKQVVVNNYFEVTFMLKNANGTEFNPPDFKGFQILSGPNSSTSMQIINGNVSREMGYSYTLQPTTAGKFTIGSATIKANGQKMSTQPINIEVVKSNSSQNAATDTGREIFIRMEPSKNKTYVGEQVSLDLKLYTTVSIDGYEIMEEPDYRGFYAQEMRRFNSTAQREIIGGRQYTTKVLRRIALYPQQAGILTISPVKFQLAVLEEADRTGFFFSRDIRPVFYTTEPIEIEVLSLPENAPADFSGAVGQYEFQTSVNRNMVTTDEAISVMMLISGTGDVKRIQPPQLVLSDSFEIYAPKIIEEQMTENQGAIIGKKVLEYLILPKFAGEYTIAPSFTYFDPLSSRYENLLSESYEINVRQGTDKHPSLENKQAHNAASNDIQFIKLRSTFKKSRPGLIGSGGFWFLSTLPIAVFIGLLFYQKRTSRSKDIDIASKRRKMAEKEARKRLEIAKLQMDSNNSRAFYEEVSKAFLGYICNKFNVPISELTKDNVKSKLEGYVSEPLIGDFMNILNTCEIALYARISKSADMEKDFQKAIDVIAGIEEGFEKSFNEQ